MRKNLLQLLTASALLLFFTSNLYSQNYTLKLKGGDYKLKGNARIVAQKGNPNPNEIFEGWFFRVFQFANIPTQEQREQIESTGVKLLDYLPHNSYLAAIPANFDTKKFADWNLRSVVAVEKPFKLHPNAASGPYPDYAKLP